MTPEERKAKAKAFLKMYRATPAAKAKANTYMKKYNKTPAAKAKAKLYRATPKIAAYQAAYRAAHKKHI